MAPTMNKLVSVLFILSLCFFLAMPSPSARITHNFINRKTLHAGTTSSSGKGNQVNMKYFYSGQLREAPQGPDPLHHHGLAPKKPHTDP